MKQNRMLFALCSVVIVLILAQDSIACPRLRHQRCACRRHAQSPTTAPATDPSAEVEQALRQLRLGLPNKTDDQIIQLLRSYVSGGKPVDGGGMRWFAVRLQQAMRQREAIAAIEKTFGQMTSSLSVADHSFVGGAEVRYAYQFHSSGRFIPSAPFPWPKRVTALVAKDFLTDVIELRISYCRVRNYDMEMIEPYLLGLPTLRKLHLGASTGPCDSVDITDDGLEYLRSLRQLTELTLEGEQFTDGVVPYIQQLKDLRALNLIGTRVTDQAITQVKQILPKCKVHREGRNESWWLYRWRDAFGRHRPSSPLEWSAVPLPEDLTGRVLSVGEDSIEVSVGVDDGLCFGHTLGVWRDGRLIASVSVVKTRPDTASAKILTRTEMAIKTGDTVRPFSKPSIPDEPQSPTAPDSPRG